MELSPSVIDETDPSKPGDPQPILRSRRPLIHVFTGFRALASLWVFAAHSGFSTYEMKSLHLEFVPQSGGAGVALFFCLSGFVMVWVYGDCSFQTRKCYCSFLGRRIARLFPLYYFALLLSIYDVRCLWSTDQPCTASNWIKIVLTLLGIGSWVPYHFIDLRWNDVLWSVQTEFFFYLVFPFSLRLTHYLLNTNQISLVSDNAQKKKLLRRLYLFWFVGFCLSGISLLSRLLIHDDLTVNLFDRKGEFIYTFPLTRIPEFLLGMLTGLIFILKSSNNTSSNQTSVNEASNLITNNEQEQPTKFPISLRNYFSKYKCQYLAFDIYFVSQIFSFIFIYSPIIRKDFVRNKYDYITYFGPVISSIVCINLYFAAKYPSSLTSKLLTTSILIDMGENSYAFYCLAPALPKVLLLISGVTEKSLTMELWGGIGISVFAHHYIEMPIYKWVNRKLPKCYC